MMLSLVLFDGILVLDLSLVLIAFFFFLLFLLFFFFFSLTKIYGNKFALK